MRSKLVRFSSIMLLLAEGLSFASANHITDGDFSSILEMQQTSQITDVTSSQLYLNDQPFAHFNEWLNREFDATLFAESLQNFASDRYAVSCVFRASENVVASAVRHDWELVCADRLVKPGQVTVFVYEGRIERIRLLMPPAITERMDIDGQTLQAWRDSRGQQQEVLKTARFFYSVRGSVLWPCVEWVENEGLVPVRWVQDLVAGTILQRETLSFGLTAKARTFLMNNSEETTEERTLEDLDSSGFLSSHAFDVFGESQSSERAEIDDSGWYREDNGDGELFNQVQTYFTLTRILKWFESKFGFDNGNDQLVVYTDTLVDGRDPDNAAYTPGNGAGSRTLQFGIGKQLRNLSTDADVAAHEFAHHVIWQNIDSRVGGARVLHEGFADYFAFAVNGDGNLAETVVPGKPYLRTAFVAEDFRYDNPKISRSEYQMGSMWAAMLWNVRLKVGDRFDQVVYRSLSLLDGTVGLDDALLAVIFADRELAGNENARCAIIDAALARGFAEFLRSEDGSSCGYDLNVEADRSMAEFEELSEDSEPRVSSESKVGKTLCGVSGAEGQSSLALTIILMLPLLLARRRYQI